MIELRLISSLVILFLTDAIPVPDESEALPKINVLLTTGAMEIINNDSASNVAVSVQKAAEEMTTSIPVTAKQPAVIFISEEKNETNNSSIMAVEAYVMDSVQSTMNPVETENSSEKFIPLTTSRNDDELNNNAFKYTTTDVKIAPVQNLEIGISTEIPLASEIMKKTTTTYHSNADVNVELHQSTESLQEFIYVSSTTTAPNVFTVEQPNTAAVESEQLAVSTFPNAQSMTGLTTESVLVRADKQPQLTYSNFLLRFFKKI